MRIKTFLCLAVIVCTTFLLGACQKTMKDVERSASVIPLDLTVGVVPFNQPKNTSALIAGYIPQNQGVIPRDVLPQLDIMLRSKLYETKRTYTWLAAPLSIASSDYHDSETPQGLAPWLNYGREYRVDFLIVPQVINWHQREGSRAGVTNPAHVRVEFFLLDVRNGRIFRRSVFEEKQVGLVDDISRVGDFFKRGGGWVTAEELTQDGIDKAMQELGLR